ncbi:MAG: FAD:protein FMN transferase [Anaerovoracaceae bacterium]
MKKRIVIMMVCLLIIITQTACGAKEPVSESGFYLDTNCTITIYGMSEKQGRAIAKEALSLCQDYDRLLSKTVKGSDVDRINSAKGSPVEVSDETLSIIKNSIALSEDSEGAFDITVGRLTDLWDFQSGEGVVPAAEAIQLALETVDYRQIKIDGNWISLGNPEAKIDLGGIAKGYISDKVAERLVDKGVSRGIVNLGGNVVTIGEKEQDTPWSVGIERPYSDRSQTIGVVSAKDKAVVTSGIYERMFVLEGKTYHHILDPKTGYPVENEVEAVTIVGPRGTAMECDGYSTVCLLLGEEQGRSFIEKKQGVEALFVDKEDKISKTSGMEFQQVK